MVASEIYASKIISEEQIEQSLKSAILQGVDKFIECLIDRLDYQYFKLQAKAEKIKTLKGSKHEEYILGGNRARRKRGRVYQERNRQRAEANGDSMHKLRICEAKHTLVREWIKETFGADGLVKWTDYYYNNLDDLKLKISSNEKN